MADVTKFSLFGQDVFIKDAQAREAVSQNTSNIENLFNIANRRFVLIGDSYGLRPTESQSWIAITKTALGEDRCYSSSVGGAGFARTGNTFEMQLTELAPSVPNPTTITDVVVVGGYNDQYFDGNTIKGAIRAFCDKAKELFPNSVVRVFFVGTNNATFNIYNTLITTVYESYGACADYGACFVDGCGVLHNNSFLVSDGVHPNATGSIYLGRFVIGHLLGGEGKIVSVTTSLTSLPEDTYNYGVINLNQCLDENVLTITSLRRASITVASSKQSPVNGEVSIPLGKFSNSFLYGDGTVDRTAIFFMAKCGFTDNTVEWKPAKINVDWSTKNGTLLVLNMTKPVRLVNIQGLGFSCNIKQA